MSDSDESERDADRRAKLRAMGERIRAARGSATQSAFANRIGCDVSSFSRWERGETEPSVASVVLIADTAGVSVDWIATGRGAGPISHPATDAA